jgi:hypothetical protein
MTNECRPTYLGLSGLLDTHVIAVWGKSDNTNTSFAVCFAIQDACKTTASGKALRLDEWRFR